MTRVRRRRNFTTKKNKTWTSDGVLYASGNYVYLRDISGKDMGRTYRGACRLDQSGSIFTVGGKEVRVGVEVGRQEVVSSFGETAMEFGNNHAPSSNTATTAAPSTIATTAAAASSHIRWKESVVVVGKRKAVADDDTPTTSTTTTTARGNSSKGVKNAYKPPSLGNTVVPRAPIPEPIARHDPNAPGAIVMKRPTTVPPGKRIVDVVVDPLVGVHLREHQKEGIRFLYECVMGMKSFNGEGAILADAMGLGKTLQTIALLWTLMKQNPVYEDPPVVRKALIVCPVTLISNWRKEFHKWLGNRGVGVFVLDDKRNRLTDFTKGRAYNVMIVGYEKLRSLQNDLAKGTGVDIIIADEGHRLKTLQNKSGQAIQSMNTAKRVILSGTPIQNDLREFFAAVDLVNPGVLGSFKTFVKDFEGPIVRSRQPEATKKDIEKGESRYKELRAVTSMFILRRTADVLAKYLPPKTEYVLFCRPTPTQANIYRHVLASPMFQYAIGNSESALQLITILKKLCNSPSLLSSNVGNNGDNRSGETASSNGLSALLASLPPKLLRHFTPSSSAKIRVLDELLHHLHTSTTEKIVLVSNYTSTLNLFATLLSSLSLPFLRLDGTVPVSKRQSLVDEFNRSPSARCFAFLLSAKAGGTGLNLFAASRLVLFDVDWNPATDLQAIARIHRDGQTRNCRIYRFLLKGSLEEKIWQRQVTKIGLADSVMSNPLKNSDDYNHTKKKKNNDNNTVAQFSREELKDLFRLDEESKCQTHDLLGCDCAGHGGIPTVADSDNGHSSIAADSEDEPSDESSIDEPLPMLIKASELNGRRNDGGGDDDNDDGKSPTGNSKMLHKRKSKMQQSLSQYTHIDPSLLSATGDGDENCKTTSTVDVQRELDDDHALLPLLRDVDNQVDFIFKTRSIPT